MMQLGFFDCFPISGEMSFTFRYQSLSDYLIARSMFDDIAGKSNEEVIEIINAKTNS